MLNNQRVTFINMKNFPLLDENGKEWWISRSIAVTGCIFTFLNGKWCVLANKRGDGETGPQIPKKCMGEAIKLVKAKFTHAIAGTLYYRITTDNIVVEFPIDMNDKDDVGTTTFVASYKPITLMRYIRKAMENETLITIDKSKLK